MGRRAAAPALCCCAAALKRGVGAVREYRLWSRFAGGRTTGQTGSSSSPLHDPSLVVRGDSPGDRAKAQPNPTARRQLVLKVMLGVVAAPGLIALATGSTTAWWVFVGMLAVFGAYLVVVFHARRLRAEREINVAFFGRANAADAGLEEVFSDADGHQLDEVGA